jgi:hypothetical protein
MKRAADNTDDLRAEYGSEFFKDLKPNRFADREKLGRVHTVERSAKRVSSRPGGKKSAKKR